MLCYPHEVDALIRRRCTCLYVWPPAMYVTCELKYCWEFVGFADSPPLSSMDKFAEFRAGDKSTATCGYVATSTANWRPLEVKWTNSARGTTTSGDMFLSVVIVVATSTCLLGLCPDDFSSSHLGSTLSSASFATFCVLVPLPKYPASTLLSAYRAAPGTAVVLMYAFSEINICWMVRQWYC